MDDAKNAPAKVSDFRNKFEKFGPSKPVRKPFTPASSGIATTSSGASTADTADALEKACKDARDFADQLQKELAEQERVRLNDRQDLMNKMEQQRTKLENEIRAIKEKNNAVSLRLQSFS
jgi:septal ring factor EnvC (AmiA/AmiB activator)